MSRSLSVRRPLFSTSLLSNPFCKKSPLHTAAGISLFQVSLFPGPVEWNTPPASRRGRGAEETLQGKSVFMICFQFCDASFKSTGYSITRKVAEAVSRTFRSADPSFLPLFFLTPFAPSAPLIFSGALNFLHEGASPGKATEKAVRPKRGSIFLLPSLGVVLRAANQDSNDCRWQSYLCFVPQ